MKKALPLVVLLAVVVGAGAWYLSRESSAVDGTRLVPDGTVFYASLPDVDRSGERWRETALAKIGNDEAVRAFLEKPLAMLEGEGGSEASEILAKVDPRSLFVAVPAIDTGSLELLLGFEFGGSQADVDDAMDRLHAEVKNFFPVATEATSDYQGDEITAVTAPNGTLYSASHGGWGFLASTEAALHGALDRAAGRSKEATLAGNEDFDAVADRLSEAPEFLWFVRVQPLVDELVKMGGEMGAQTTGFETEQIRQIEAIGGTLTFDGLDQNETLFVLAPGLETKYPTLQHDGMAFTTPDTSIFFEAIQDWSAIRSPDYAASLPEELREFLTANEIDLGQLASWFGGDTTIVVNWAPNAMFPSVLAAMDIENRAEIETVVDRAASGAGLELTSSELAGARVLAFPALPIQLVDPVVAISDEYLFAALTSADLARALQPDPEARTLADAPGFAKAKAAYDTPAQGFGYIDAKVVFERLYNQLRPVVTFAAAMSPDIAEKVDVSKLPETEAIAQYLRPITYVQRQVEGGWLMESSGPITISQTSVLLGLGVGAGVYSQMMATPPTP